MAINGSASTKKSTFLDPIGVLSSTVSGTVNTCSVMLLISVFRYDTGPYNFTCKQDRVTDTFLCRRRAGHLKSLQGSKSFGNKMANSPGDKEKALTSDEVVGGSCMENKGTHSLLPHNVAFFTIFASRGIVASFFPLYLKQVGLNAQQIGTVMFFRPLGGMIGALVCPYITQKVQSERFQKQYSSSNQKCMTRNDFFQVLSTRTNMAWLFVLFSRSIFYAVTQGFLPWHMENLGASPALIGACHFVTSATEFFMFFATPKLIQVFGHSRLVNIGLVSYICRFLLFAIISNPVWVLPVEIMEGVMFACIFSSLVSFLSNQVPEEGQTQIQGVIQALSMLGNGVGFPVSGFLTQLFGAPAMFLVFDGLAVITFAVFALHQTPCCADQIADHKHNDKQ